MCIRLEVGVLFSSAGLRSGYFTATMVNHIYIMTITAIPCLTIFGLNCLDFDAKTLGFGALCKGASAKYHVSL